MTLHVTPSMFAHCVDNATALFDAWGWHTQQWGQETISEPIRNILGRTENGLRHIGDLLIAREAVAQCPKCHRPHDALVCHVDVKSTTRSYDRQTGKVTLEVRSWAALRDETRTQIPAVFTFEPFNDCEATQLLWVPAVKLDGNDMIFGPQTGNGSRDPYWLVPTGMMRPITSLRCWDGWS